MSTISHGPSTVPRERRSRPLGSLLPEVWLSLAVSVIWLAVLFDAIFGPDIVSVSASGDRTSVPSVVPVGLFAFLATWVFARFAFPRRERDNS
jgi:hypothetical protein